MLKLISAVLAGLLLTAFLGCRGADSPAPVTTSKEKAAAEVPRISGETEWQRLAAEARKEGKVMVYSTPSGEVMRALGSAFKERFGVDVDFVVGRGAELARRMEAERAANLSVVDVVMSGGPTLQTTMKPAKLLGKLEPLLILPEVTDRNAWITGNIPWMDKDHTGIAMVAIYQQYIVRNSDMVEEKEITSFKDLLNPKWKGKLPLDDPTVAGNGNGFFTTLAVHMWGMEQTKEFMRQIVRQEPALTRENRLLGEWVAKGKYPLAVGTAQEVATEFLRLGSPVAFVKVAEGSNISPAAGGVGIAAGGPHPNATKLFVNWLLSRDGHAVFVKAFGSPGARKDAPREGIPQEAFAEPGEKVYPDTEEAILARPEMMKVAREIFGPLAK